MIVICPGCFGAVFPKSDDSCPSCGSSTRGATEAPRISQAELDAKAVRKRLKIEALRDHALGRTRRSMTWIGALMVVGGVLLTVISYESAREGETYVVWTGAIVTGILLMIKAQR